MARRPPHMLRAINARMTTGFTAAETRALHALLMRAHENLRPSPRNEGK